MENLMANDDHWAWQEKEMVEDTPTTEKGYHEMGTHNFVPDEEAYDYALCRCLNGSEEDQKEFKKMLVEWFYSGGDWRREE